jgi:hypothetical protein
VRPGAKAFAEQVDPPSLFYRVFIWLRRDRPAGNMRLHLGHHQGQRGVGVGDHLFPRQQNIVPGAAGAHKVAPAGHHAFHRLQLILRLTAGIRPPGGEDKIGIQLRQLFSADVNALAVGDPSISGGKRNPASRSTRPSA